MKHGPIPEYNIDIPDGQAGIEMVRAVVDNRWVWVEQNDPCLDGCTITRDSRGSLVTTDKIRRTPDAAE